MKRSWLPRDTRFSPCTRIQGNSLMRGGRPGPPRQGPESISRPGTCPRSTVRPQYLRPPFGEPRTIHHKIAVTLDKAKRIPGRPDTEWSRTAAPVSHPTQANVMTFFSASMSPHVTSTTGTGHKRAQGSTASWLFSLPALLSSLSESCLQLDCYGYGTKCLEQKGGNRPNCKEKRPGGIPRNRSISRYCSQSSLEPFRPRPLLRCSSYHWLEWQT